MNKKIEINLADLMNEKLIKNANNQDTDNLESAVDYLNSAFDLFEDLGMSIEAEKVLNLLQKIAKEDPHTKGLSSEKMIQNLKHHGTEFNMFDLNDIDDQDIDLDEALYVDDNDADTFED